MRNSARKKEVKKTQIVRGIFGPGVYSFRIGSDPDFKYGSIPGHIKKTFPNIIARFFRGAMLSEEEYTPAKFDIKKDWSRDTLYVTNYLSLGEQHSMMNINDHSSNGGAWGGFVVEDIGEISIVKNKLVISKKCDLDGKVLMHYDGTVPHFGRGGSTSSNYKVEIVGHNPGDVVFSTIGFINSELRRTDKYLHKEI